MALPVHTDPIRFWLQLGADATTEMYVTWNEVTSAYATTAIEMREAGASTWTEVAGTSVIHPFTGDGYTPAQRLIHRVHLTGLTPGASYEFRLVDGGTVRSFRTFPAELPSEGVKIAIVGDGGDATAIEDLCDRMAAREPDAVLVGGDWCYADGLASNYSKWDSFWKRFGERMTPGGRVIPVIPCIGNHEAVGGYGTGRADAQYFYNYFVIPDDHSCAYHEVKAGNYFSLAILDSEHTSGPVDSEHEQIVWLEGVLAANASYTHRLAAWHVPFYPGSRDYAGAQQTRLRTAIAPVIEAAGIRTAFDFHDHLYCRTKRIKAGEVDETGVVYIGQGNWGQPSRTANNAEAWYVDEVYGTGNSNYRHFLLATLTDAELVVESVNGSGITFHTHTDEVAAPGVLAGQDVYLRLLSGTYQKVTQSAPIPVPA